MIRMFSLSCLALALACSNPGTTVSGQSAQPSKAAEPFVPVISLRPVAISLSAGTTQTFQAEINYPEGVRYLKQPVGWQVMELNGGVITGAGLYTAPTVAGIYHVRVRREDFPEVTAMATVTVK